MKEEPESVPVISICLNFVHEGLTWPLWNKAMKMYVVSN